MEHGDYKNIAHIANCGKITWYVEPSKIPGDALLRIEHDADAMHANFEKWLDSMPKSMQYEKLVDMVPINIFLYVSNLGGGIERKIEYNDICKDIMDAFFDEKCKHDNRYNAGRIGKQDLFIDWMQGLPTALDLADDIFLGSAVDWLGDILEQTDTEKARYTDEQAEKTACYLLYRELTKHAAKAN